MPIQNKEAENDERVAMTKKRPFKTGLCTVGLHDDCPIWFKALKEVPCCCDCHPENADFDLDSTRPKSVVKEPQKSSSSKGAVQ